MDNEMAALEAQTKKNQIDSFEKYVETDSEYQLVNDLISDGVLDIF